MRRRYTPYLLCAACFCSLSGCGESGHSAVGCYRGVDTNSGRVRVVTISHDDGTNYVGSIGSYFVRGAWGVPMASTNAAWRLNKGQENVDYHFVATADGAVVNKIDGIALAHR